jgi:methionyl aminopeptidase
MVEQPIPPPLHKVASPLFRPPLPHGVQQRGPARHGPIEEQIGIYRLKGYEVPHRKLLKTKQQIEGIRESSKRNIALLDFIANYAVDGITTEELDRLIFEKTKELGGVPATLSYEGYPKSVCISKY